MFAERFTREVQALAALNYPNIVPKFHLVFEQKLTLLLRSLANFV